MRVALAGLGGATVHGHLPAIEARASDLDVVAAADPDPRRRALVTARLGDVPVFRNTEAMLDAVDADLLVVATEPSAHARVASLALERGVHVLCEKPVTLTRRQHQLLTRVCRREAGLALVPVHQYRYSPTWSGVARWARVANRLRVPFTIDVRIARATVDRHAVAPWRADIAASGGMLADHAVHFLALGWTVSENLEILLGSRATAHPDAERSSAEARLGRGRLKMTLTRPAAARHSQVELRLPHVAFQWSDEAGLLTFRGRHVWFNRVESLSDRRHVDALYRPLYRDLIENLSDARWRRRRTAEALGVSSALVTLLEIVAM